MKEKRKISILSAAMGLCCALSVPAVVLAAETLSSAQKAEVQEMIGAYLKENPEVVIEAIQAWRKQQDAAEAAITRKAIAELMAEAADTKSPVWGNPEGNTIVVEFFDYNCPYCKKVFPSMEKLIAEDGDIKIVMKELPVLGPDSEYAAKAALAAQMQGKYDQFHARMMNQGGRLSREGVLAAAKAVDLDLNQLQKDMQSPEVQQELARSSAWAQRLGVNGTPAFVIGEELIPGAIDGQRMKQYVELARKKNQQ
ncbi:DsbA family protein [Thiolapillus sp.]